MTLTDGLRKRTEYHAADEIEDLRAALDTCCGYMLNAKIDLETGRTKRAAIRILEDGLKFARIALKQSAQ